MLPMKTLCGGSVNNTQRPLWTEINNPFSITSQACRAVSDYIRNAVQWQNLLSGQISVSLWFAFCPYCGLPGGRCCYFERQLAWQACWGSKSWSEGVFPKAFHGLHLILVAGVVALAPKSFFTLLRAPWAPGFPCVKWDWQWFIPFRKHYGEDGRGCVFKSSIFQKPQNTLGSMNFKKLNVFYLQNTGFEGGSVSIIDDLQVSVNFINF